MRVGESVHPCVSFNIWNYVSNHVSSKMEFSLTITVRSRTSWIIDTSINSLNQKL